MAWSLRGQSIELCSCKMLCPCWLGPAEPDQGWCSGALILDIQQGNSNGVDLGGRKVAFAADWPGDFWSGNGTARLYIDEAANSDQRRELEAILGGKQGGPWEVIKGTISNWLPAQAITIDIQWGESPSARVGNFGDVKSQPLKDQAGQPTKIQGGAAMAAFQIESMNLSSSKGSRWSDPEMRRWEGDSGNIINFNWGA